jgi:hypothetical protein
MRESSVDLDTTLLNVAILPTYSTSEEVEHLSAKLQALGGLFRIDGRERFAHLTLYMARFANSDIDSIMDRTADFMESYRSLSLRHVGYFLTPGNYYEASYAKTDRLLSSHESLVDTLRPLRFSPGRPVKEKYFEPYSSQQRAYAEETGYDLAKALYRPHITISRFAENPGHDLPVASRDLSFKATKIGLFKADPLGAVTDPLAVWTA